MAKIEFKGIEQYSKQLQKLSTLERRGVISPAVYAGADIVADEIRSETENLPTAYGHGSPERMLAGVTPKQKRELAESMGISSMRDDNGYLNVKIGFAGYNSIRTKRWPNGQPNAMIARSIVRGTSFMVANSFIDRATRRAKKKAEKIMDTVISSKIYAIFKD